MSSKQQGNQAAKILPFTLLVLLATLGFAGTVNAEVKTLFTTTHERQIINANRYKNEEIVKPRIFEESETEFIAPLVQEEFKISFVISGITISDSGPHFVWINNQLYEDGGHLEDDSLIRVLHDANIRVRITAPDGKCYFGTSGETVEVTYLVGVEN